MKKQLCITLLSSLSTLLVASESRKLEFIGSMAEVERNCVIPIINRGDSTIIHECAEWSETARLREGSLKGPRSLETFDRFTCLLYTAAMLLEPGDGPATRGFSHWIQTHPGKFFNPWAKGDYAQRLAYQRGRRPVFELLRDTQAARGAQEYLKIGDRARIGSPHNEPDEAIALLIYTLGAARFDKNQEFPDRLGLLFDTKDSLFACNSDLAVRYGEEALALKPDDAKLRLTLADRYFSLSKLQKSRDLYCSVAGGELSVVQWARKIATGVLTLEI